MKKLRESYLISTFLIESWGPLKNHYFNALKTCVYVFIYTISVDTIFTFMLDPHVFLCGL